MTKVEYVVASDAAKETLWLGWLAHTFQQVDSDSAQRQSGCCQSVEKFGSPQRLEAYWRSISLWSGLRHFKEIGLEKISTSDNMADGMTKCLSADWFGSLRHQMDVTKNRFDWSRTLKTVLDNQHWLFEDRFSSSDPDWFGLLSSNIADSNKNDLFDNLV